MVKPFKKVMEKCVFCWWLSEPRPTSHSTNAHTQMEISEHFTRFDLLLSDMWNFRCLDDSHCCGGLWNSFQSKQWLNPSSGKWRFVRNWIGYRKDKRAWSWRRKMKRNLRSVMTFSHDQSTNYIRSPAVIGHKIRFQHAILRARISGLKPD